MGGSLGSAGGGFECARLAWGQLRAVILDDGLESLRRCERLLVVRDRNQGVVAVVEALAEVVDLDHERGGCFGAAAVKQRRPLLGELSDPGAYLPIRGRDRLRRGRGDLLILGLLID